MDWPLIVELQYIWDSEVRRRKPSCAALPRLSIRAGSVSASLISAGGFGLQDFRRFAGGGICLLGMSVR